MRLSTSAGAIAAVASAGALLFTMVGPAAAMPEVVGTGSPTCTAGWAGSLTFNPALQAGGTATTEEMAINVKFSGCTGGTPVPTAGRYVGKSIVQGPGANDCANWFAAPAGTPPFKIVTFNGNPLDGSVAWSPAGISGSNASFSNMRMKTGTNGRLVAKLPDASGTSTVTGSYAPTAALTLRIQQPYTTITTACGGTGLPSLAIVQSNPGGSSAGTW